jgi:prophage regulatory protein
MESLRILRLHEVEAKTGLKRSMLDLLERDSAFPPRIRIGKRATGWRSDEVDAWIKSRPRVTDQSSEGQEHLEQHREKAIKKSAAKRAKKRLAA